MIKSLPMSERILLSPSFTLAELTRTDHREFVDANYEAARTDPEILQSLIHVARELLQPVRDHFMRPIFVHSGFRLPALNQLVGGVPSSQHMTGEAADFTMPGVSCAELFNFVHLQSQIIYGQLLWEGCPQGWIHISLPTRKFPVERHAMTATWNHKQGKMIFTPVRPDQEVT